MNAIEALEAEGKAINAESVGLLARMDPSTARKIRRTLTKNGKLCVSRWPMLANCMETMAEKAIAALLSGEPPEGVSCTSWVCQIIGCSHTQGFRIRRLLLGRDAIAETDWPVKSPVFETASDRDDGDPTPEQIRERCLEIRSSWDDTTYRQRAGLRLDGSDAVSMPFARIYMDGRKLQEF